MQAAYDILGLIGAALIVGGTWLYSPALAAIIAGALLVSAAFLLTLAGRAKT